MNKILLIPAVLLPIISGTPVFAGDMNGMYMPSGQMSPSATQQVRSTSVTIQNFAFMPSTIMVAQGATVTWTNHDSTAHTVTGNTSGGPGSGMIQPGQSYSFTFKTAGTFPYHCSIHPQMTGSVVVTASTTSSAPPTQSSQPTGSQSTTNSQGGASSSNPKGPTPVGMTPSTHTQPTSPSTAKQLPNTGSTDALALFAVATALGVGTYYLFFFLRKKSRI